MNAKKREFEIFLDANSDTQVGRLLNWHTAETDEEKLSAIEQLMEQTYRLLEYKRGILAKMNRWEGGITVQIVQMLQAAGVDATHETHVNGHCNILVTHPQNFKWIAEVKIHRGYKSLVKGFLHLSTRYGKATPHRDHGEFIIYNKKGNSKKILKEWKVKLLANHEGVDLTEDKIESSMFFRTKHVCPNSGLPFHFRHVIVPFQHSQSKR